MSYFDTDKAPCVNQEGAIAQLIEPRSADLGEFSVRRALPSRERRMVGPFVFFDHMGPAEFSPGSGINVRPHPHIGTATITYLLEGEIMHRDSLGVQQPIQAGAVNLMVAGQGIVHSERPGADLDQVSRLHGIQSWIALPAADQEMEPLFTHYAAAELPDLDIDGAKVRIIMGTAYGETSPVQTFSETLYLDCAIPGSAGLTLPTGQDELALYVATGSIEIADETIGAGVMAVAATGVTLRIKAREESRVMVIGGANIGSRHIDWNFVSDNEARIEQAKQDWKDGNFRGVPGDDEYIPYPVSKK